MSKLKSFEFSSKWRQERISYSMRLVSMFQQTKTCKSYSEFSNSRQPVFIPMPFLNKKRSDNQQHLIWKIFRRASNRSPVFLNFSHCLGVKYWQTCCPVFILAMVICLRELWPESMFQLVLELALLTDNRRLCSYQEILG